MLGVTDPVTLLNHISQCHEYLHLNGRTVLELIHEQVGVSTPNFCCHLLILEQLVHIMLDVAKVHNTFVQLILRILLVPFLSQSEDGLNILLLKVIHLLAAPDVLCLLFGIFQNGDRYSILRYCRSTFHYIAKFCEPLYIIHIAAVPLEGIDSNKRIILLARLLASFYLRMHGFQYSYALAIFYVDMHAIA